jgi:hypothetical protein
MQFDDVILVRRILCSLVVLSLVHPMLRDAQIVAVRV